MRFFMFLACTLSLAYAQQLSSPRPNDSTLVPPVRPFHLPPRTGIETQMDVSLDQALAMALANNKDIESSRIDRLESDYSLTAALGAFDPQLNVTSYWEQQITPIASSLGGSATGSLLNKTWQADPGITQPLPWYGGTFKTDLSSADAYSNNTFLSLNPQYETSLNFSYTQPLWRNLLYDSNRHQIDVAKKNRSLTDEQFRQRVMAVVLQTEQAYWELSYAYNNLQVQLDAVRIGIQQDESNRRQEQQGLLAPIDVVAAQTQLANFEVGAYAAQSALTAAENALKELVLPDRTDSTWSSALIPTTPEDVQTPLTPLSDAIAEAMANRPEIAEVKINGEINEKDVRYYRDQTKPQVNLTALYTRAGLAGTLLPAGPNPFTAGFGPLTNQLNELSALAGLPPLPTISFGGSTIPPVLVGGYGHSLSRDLGRKFSDHGGATEHLTADPEPNRRREPRQIPGGDAAHPQSNAADRAEHSIRCAQRDGECPDGAAPAASRASGARIGRRAVSKRAAPVSRWNLHVVPGAAAAGDHDHRAQPGAAIASGPERSHRAIPARDRNDSGRAKYCAEITACSRGARHWEPRGCYRGTRAKRSAARSSFWPVWCCTPRPLRFGVTRAKRSVARSSSWPCGRWAIATQSAPGLLPQSIYEQ